MATNQEARHAAFGGTGTYNEAAMSFNGGTGTFNERALSYFLTANAPTTRTGLNESSNEYARAPRGRGPRAAGFYNYSAVNSLT